MRNKNGFTSIEMLLVCLLMLSVLLFLPAMHQYDRLQLNIAANKVHQFLLKHQKNAMYHHKQEQILFSDHQLHAPNDTLDIHPVHCIGNDYHYTEFGTVSQGQTIYLQLHKQHCTLVIQIGSGCLDIRF